VVGGHVGGQFKTPLSSPVNVPRKGSCTAPCACVRPGATVAVDGDVGESRTCPLQAPANIHIPKMIGLIGLPPLNNDSNGGSVLVLGRRVHPPKRPERTSSVVAASLETDSKRV